MATWLWLALAGAPATTAQGEDGRAPTPEVGPNIKFTLTVGDVEAERGPTVRRYALIARDGGSPASMLMGWRTPIPTSSASDDASGPVTSYTYQNLGMTARLEARIVGQGRIAVSGAVEVSGARRESPLPSAATHAPTIGTFRRG